MTKEQEEAIEIISKYLNFNEICGTRNFKEALEKVLNMLKENSAEIEQKNTELAEKSAEIKKKDKIIDLMSEWLYEDDTSFGYGKLKDINTSEKNKTIF